jgi:diguanylate cyclase (GGDEF)-like protein
MPKASLLIVDDTPENIDLIVSMLGRQDLDIMAATSGERALELVARRVPDLILLDVMMPGIDGFETCRRLRSLPALTEVPIVFVTAKVDDVGSGFAAGGADYITKPVRADELRARVQHHLERRRLLHDLKQLNQHLDQRVRERTQELVQANRQLREEINERRFMQDRLTYLATHDFVTRLYNRDALESQVQKRLVDRMPDGENGSENGSLLIVDLARFRIVNDTCGYIAGDELLRQVADLLAALCAPDEFIARLGGDRFALLSKRTAEDAMQIGQQIKQSFDSFEFQWGGRGYQVSARVAVVPLSSEYASFDQVMAKADEASYLVRREGGNIVRLHRSHIGEADPRESVNWAHRLMDAIKLNQFRVFFQRVVPLQSQGAGKLHFEVLVRLWDVEQQRVVAPGAFMQPAERYQLIDQIDRWMLREVLTRLSDMGALLEQVGQVAVNLSAQSLRDPRLAESVEALLNELSFPADKLCFEITEGEAIVNLDLAQTFMNKIKALGIRFALDDFGTGFASFAYLKQLPFDRLKIDGAFVRDMDTDAANATMVASMVQMAQALELPVVAEFVERGAVLTKLRELGVQYAQGYYFHQPEELTEASLRNALGAPSSN